MRKLVLTDHGGERSDRGFAIAAASVIQAGLVLFVVLASCRRDVITVRSTMAVRV